MSLRYIGREMATVLIIDDDLVLCELYNAYFEAEGMSDWYAQGESDLERALEIIATDKPEIIFLDNRLPPYDDFTESLQKIIDIGFTGPVVVQSACVDDEIFNQAEERGATMVQEKWQVSSSSLAETVRRLSSGMPGCGPATF